MLLWAFVYKVLCGHMFSYLLGMYLGIELLDRIVTITFLRSVHIVFSFGEFFLSFLFFDISE